MGKDVLLLGGGGFIGSSLSRVLIQEGYDVTVVARGNIPDVKTVVCDVFDVDSYMKELKTADIVCNLIGLRKGAEEEIKKSNYDLPKLLLDEITSQQIFVQFGTRLQYGEQKIPVPEEALCNPTDPYGVYKLKAEKLLRTHEKSICLRLSNVYGPGDTGIVGTIAKLLSQGKTFTVFDGSQLKDLIHVDDCVRAVLACLASPDALGQVFNAGSGIAMPMQDVALQIHEEIGKGKVVVDANHVSGDVSFCADVGKINKLTGWSPKVGFREGIKTVARR